MEEIKCYHCHKLFKGRPNRKFCSKDCSNRNKKSLTKKAVCPNCGETFRRDRRKMPNGKYRFQVFCSMKCRTEMSQKIRGNYSCRVCGEKKDMKTSDVSNMKKRREGSYGGKNVCSRKCLGAWQSLHTTLIDPDLPMHNLRYKYKGFVQAGYACEKCGFDENPEILTVHHVKGKKAGNGWENLEVLCPNCHAKEHQKGGPTWQKQRKAVENIRQLYKTNETFRELFHKVTGHKLRGIF